VAAGLGSGPDRPDGYAEACLCIGGAELPGAERSARRLIERAPLSEIGYRMLMQVLAARGDTAAALAVYDRLRRAVRDELGVDPGPEVRRLHRRLLQAASDISRRDPTRASSPAEPLSGWPG